VFFAHFQLKNLKFLKVYRLCIEILLDLKYKLSQNMKLSKTVSDTRMLLFKGITEQLERITVAAKTVTSKPIKRVQHNINVVQKAFTSK
jgi:hypothetical protein